MFLLTRSLSSDVKDIGSSQWYNKDLVPAGIELVGKSMNIADVSNYFRFIAQLEDAYLCILL